MICRLCLESLSDDCLSIFKENEEATESETAKIIAKYFQIELQLENEVSNKICISCWRHLHDFHQFWLSIEQKQEALRDCDIKCDLSSLLVQDGMVVGKGALGSDNQHFELPQDVESLDVKTDIRLVEPEIHVSYNEDEQVSSRDAQEFAEAFADGVSSGGDDDSDADFEPKPKPTKRKYTKSADKTKEAPAKRAPRRACVTKLTKEKKPAKAVNKAKATTSQRPNLLAISREMDTYIAAQVPDLSCCMCSEPLSDFTVLKKHFRIVHKCVGYVRCCRNRFKKRALYVDHLKWHDDPDFFKCLECQKRLRTRNCYENHMATVHPPEDKLNFQCEFCPRKFAKQYILDYHLKKHREVVKNHLCELCQKPFRTTHELETHHKRVHLNLFATMCDICGKHFKSKANLEYHMEYLHKDNIGRTEVQCEICQKWLRDARSLSKHMFRHREEASEKQFVCGECGAVKPTRTILAGHIRYHHPKEIFKCTLCVKEFKRQLALDEHMATHTGIALYACSFCTRTFKSHANMHNHKKKMHPTEWVRKYSQPSKPVSSSVSNEIDQTVAAVV